MSGRLGWMKPSAGRPPKQPDLIRCPEGSWWLEPEHKDRCSFQAKAAREQPRMQKFGISPDPLVWKN